jgi:ketosteroid isomerase-like protein
MSFHDEVVALERQFLEAFARGDAVAATDVYTDDVVYMVPGKEPARGRDAMMAVNAEDIASGLKITRLTPFRTESSGDLGYVLETYSSSSGDGFAMLTYRRQADGAWRICAEALL